MNKFEKHLSAFSEIYFYKDLVQENLLFKTDDKTEYELADLLLNLDDLIIAIQLKERNELFQTNDQEEELRWLNKKCREAKKQIKDTIHFILNEQLPEFQNLRGEKISINKNADIIPLIIFKNDVIDDYPHVLLKHSESGFDVNCISYSDFQEICKTLVTPIEIASYFKYRIAFYKNNPQVDIFIDSDEDDNIILTRPQKEIALVHQFLSTEYNIQIASEKKDYLYEFQDFLHSLQEHTVEESEELAHHSILLFLAHFNRLEIKAFNERLQRAIIKSRNRQYGIVGSLRNEDIKYAIIFVAPKPGYIYRTEDLLKIVRQKVDVNKLLQIVVYWENSEQYRVDFFMAQDIIIK